MLVHFGHLLGMSLWIGGMVAAMAVATQVRSENVEASGISYRLLGRLYSVVIAPGAALTVLTGLGLTMSLAQRSGSEIMALPRIWGMQLTGLAAGVLVLFIGLPTATQLARIAASVDGAPMPSLVAGLRRRLTVVAHLVALLALASLVFAVLVR